jgi:intracellular sulfur oxidation DsrE/DsrF family protein
MILTPLHLPLAGWKTTFNRVGKMLKFLKNNIIVFLCSFALFAGASADGGNFDSDADHKVVYDVKTRSLNEFSNVLDRISYLNSRLGNDPLSTSIVVVLHGNEIEYFAREKELDYEAVVERTQSLITGETIDFRVCRVSAKRRGYQSADLQSFVDIVPMADAEIVQLQFKGYAYMR